MRTFHEFVEAKDAPELLDPNLLAQTAEPGENPRELMQKAAMANKLSASTRKPVQQVATALSFKDKLKGSQQPNVRPV